MINDPLVGLFYALLLAAGGGLLILIAESPELYGRWREYRQELAEQRRQERAAQERAEAGVAPKGKRKPPPQQGRHRK